LLLRSGSSARQGADQASARSGRRQAAATEAIKTLQDPHAKGDAAFRKGRQDGAAPVCGEADAYNFNQMTMNPNDI
jgi:hypothetical protein